LIKRPVCQDWLETSTRNDLQKDEIGWAHPWTD